MAKYFITGGSGFLGINLIRYLTKQGHQVVSLDIAPFEYPEKDTVTHIIGNICDQSLVTSSMKGCDAVIHTAAALPLYSAEEIRKTDIEGVRVVLEAAVHNGIERFVHVSSTAVYGIPDHHPLLETDELHGVGEYGKAKIAAEELCAEYRQKGLCVSIIRPKSFVGPERLGVFALLYDWAASGKNFPILGNGKNRYQLLDVEDLCQAIYLCLQKPKEIVNDVFNVGAENFGTMREDYQSILDAAGFNKRIISIPALPAVWCLRVLEFLRISPLYKWVYETAYKDSFVSIQKAQEKLGYVPRYSNIDALLRNYNWYVANRENFKNTEGVSHRVPWKQGILGLVKSLF